MGKKPRRRLKKRATRTRGNAAQDREALRREFSNPVKLERHIKRLEMLMDSEPELKALRFPTELLLDEENAFIREMDDRESSSPGRDDLEAFFLRLYARVLTRRFIRRVEKVFLSIMDSSKALADVKAAAAGLFLLEIHRKQPETVLENPLWHLIYDVSQREARASVGNRIVAPKERDAGETGRSLPLADMESELDVSAEQREMMRKAIGYLEDDTVVLGFSFDTILQGVRAVFRLPETVSPADRIAALRKTYRREIREQEREDLLWGLDYMADEVSRENAAAFETVSRMVSMLPARDNPVIYALYFKCVDRFYRYLKPDESQWAQAILSDIDAPDPVVGYGCYLLREETNKRALKAFEAALAIDGTCEPARVGAGIALWRRNAFREARLHWNRARKHWSGYLAADAPALQICERLEALEDHDAIPADCIAFFYESASFSTKIEPDAD